MRNRSSRPEYPATAKPASIPAEAALSFLKDTKGALSWTLRDLADTLKVSRRDAEQVAALLQAQGYAKRSGTGEWVTTPEGESVAGAKAPRFTRESVQDAVASLKDRIKQINKDPNAPFRISSAVAFGDFLFSDRARVQAADVGIGLQGRGAPSPAPSAPEARAERAFLRQLRAKSAALHLRPYAPWMSQRSHVVLS